MSNQLQSLSNEFNMLINKYQETYQNYLNVINSDKINFETVVNASYNGENKINTITDTNVNNCQTECSSNSSCSGATFNTTSNNCTLISGTGNIIKTQKSTAIVEEAIYYSYQLKKMNAKLIEINKKMLTTSNNNYNSFKKSQQENEQQEQTINNNYKTLSDERSQIEQMIREYETLNRAYDNANVNTTSNYYSYIALLFITILLIFLFFKFSLDGSQSGGSNKMLNSLNKLYKFLPVLLALLAIFIFIKNNFDRNY